MRAPSWARGVLAGVVYGGCMVAWSRSQSDDPAPLVVSLVIGLLGGAVFGLTMALVTARHERRLFQVGGRSLDGDQRLAVRRALMQGHLPEDRRLREAAVNLADSQLRPVNSPITTIALFAGFGGLAVWQAVSGEPLWWLGVAFWIIIGGVVLFGQRRDRQRAHRLLQASSELRAASPASHVGEPGQRGHA